MVKKGAILLSLAMIALCVIAASFSDRFLFLKLKLNRKDSTAAQPIARTLARSHTGIDLAVADIGLSGGKTRGWSSWILKNAEDKQYAQKLLGQIAEDAGAPDSKRMEACFLLYEITGQYNFLKIVFDYSRYPGETDNLTLARYKLATYIDPLKGANVIPRINLVRNEPLSISFDEIQPYLKNQIPTRQP